MAQLNRIQPTEGEDIMRRDERTGELFNEDRADRAQAALDAYIAHTGDSPDESHFRDLLCDLRHLAARDGAGDRFDDQEGSLTFDEANEVAGRCFEDEEEIEANADENECGQCEGTGTTDAMGYSEECPVCDGSGVLEGGE